MKKKYTQILLYILFLFCSLVPSVSKALTDSLITTNSSWKYLDNGSNQGTAWRSISFNDVSWATGTAQLGYGDGDEATVVNYGNAANNKYITTYFRKSFTVPNAAIYSSLTFGIVRDDGAIVYLNGTEVYRTNMPSGNVNNKTKASSDITGSNESTFIYFTISTALLVSGTNTVAVEIHQFDKASPDISFRLNLAALQVSCFSPTGLSTTGITTNSATLNWTAVSGAAGYNIRYRIVGNPAWSTTTSSTSSAALSSLIHSSGYEWQVQTDCGSGNLSGFSSSSFFTTATPPCGIPAGLTTSNITSISATLHWAAVTGAMSYNIEYRIIGSPSWITTTSTTDSVNISSLTASSGYEWHVRSDCGNGNTSGFSLIDNFSTPAPGCGTATGLAAYGISSSSAVLSWDQFPGAVSYNYRYRQSGAPSWITSSTSSLTADITGLPPVNLIEWQVQIECSASLGSFSASQFFTTQSSSANDTLIAGGSFWKYNDSGANLGTSWRNPGYNDTSWPFRPAELGYGDGDEATVVSYGPDPNNKYTTTYFRESFNVNNPADYLSLLLNIVRDDGAVVYLNGTEVYRSNMPGGTIAYNTFASAAIGGTDEFAWYSANVSTSLLVTGTNVIAVEIHQSNLTSSDISFNFRLLGSRIPSVTQGPYLQSLTPSSVIIRWLTNVPAASRVRCGLSTSGYPMNFYDAASVTDHSVEVSGLSPATKYYYTVENVTYILQGDNDNHFYTSPVTPAIVPVRVWVIGDFGDGSSGQASVRDAYVNYAGPDYTHLWLWLGDNAYSTGTEAEYQGRVFNVYPQQFKKMPLYPSIGNHDYAQSGYQSSSSLTTNFPYFRIVSVPTAAEAGGIASGTEKYYSYNYSNIHFIALDSYGSFNNPGSPMYNWLVNDLDDNRQRWTIVYFHHPPYTKGSHDSDADPELVNMRQNILPVLEDYNVDLVLSGHSHVNERTPLIKGHFGTSGTFNASMIVQGGSGAKPNPYVKSPPYSGTVYAVGGTGGQLSSGVQAGWPMPCMFFSNNTSNASLVIDIDGDELNCKFLSSAVTIIDEFTIVKTGSSKLPEEGDAIHPWLAIIPNPVTNETHIAYTLSDDAQVRLDVFNLIGEKVYSLMDEKTNQSKGYHELAFSPSACGLSPGIYSVRLSAGEDYLVQRMVFVK